MGGMMGRLRASLDLKSKYHKFHKTAGCKIKNLSMTEAFPLLGCYAVYLASCCRTTYWPNIQGSSIPRRMLKLEGGTDTLS